jgi:hypothetical protein
MPCNQAVSNQIITIYQTQQPNILTVYHTPTLTRGANRTADAAEGPMGGGIDAGCPQCANNNSPYGIDFGLLSLSSLPPLDKFCIPGLAFGREEEDKDGDGDGL